jgi:hypothetical protein
MLVPVVHNHLKCNQAPAHKMLTTIQLMQQTPMHNLLICAMKCRNRIKLLTTRDISLKKQEIALQQMQLIATMEIIKAKLALLQLIQLQVLVSNLLQVQVNLMLLVWLRAVLLRQLVHQLQQQQQRLCLITMHLLLIQILICSKIIELQAIISKLELYQMLLLLQVEFNLVITTNKTKVEVVLALEVATMAQVQQARAITHSKIIKICKAMPQEATKVNHRTTISKAMGTMKK